MRLAPVPMFYFPEVDRILHFSGESSRTTHGAEECIDASRLFGEILFRTLSGANKIEILLKHNTDTQNPDRTHGAAIAKPIATPFYKK